MVNLYKRFLEGVNQISCIMICAWMCWPFFNVKTGTLPVLMFFIIWLLTTDFRWLIKKGSLDLVFTIMFFMTFFPYIITGSLQYGEAGSNVILVNFPLFFAGMFINHYYMYFKKDYVTVGRIALFCLVMFSIGSVQTIWGLEQFPMASRILATANAPMKDFYSSLGIGGFSFVYSAVFVSIALLYFIIGKKPGLNKYYKILITITFVLFVVMILKALYAIALILILIGIALILILKNKRRLYLIASFLLIFILVFPKEIIGQGILQLAFLFGEERVIGEKLIDFASSFLQNEMGEQTAGRFQLYLTSLKTFLKNPFFGIYGPFGNASDRIGWHSGWLDLMGLYGLFTTVPMFIAIIINIKKHLFFYSKHPYYRYLLVTQIMFIFFGFINPIIYIYQIGFTFFLIGPSVPFIPYVFNKKECEI